MDDPYYRYALALAHHEGFGQHADRCAPGIPALLAAHGVGARVGSSFGTEPQPAGLVTVTGARTA